MMLETVETLGQDAAAVAAVRGGDAERYRELVERHERRVYAVAWSRLGDAALAEEATQEAFIRGYRRLWLLADGKKFSGWITTIARNAAINLGLRHRRELNKRERWALEQPAASPSESAEICSPETLRSTLAELPAAHRECLVLFYLEGKSGAEAAAALATTEAAFRVRLHRARAALRAQLEQKLEGSLAKLGPSRALVPVIMATVLASSSAKAAATGGTVAAGAGVKVVSALGKSVLSAWLVPALSLVGNIPGLLFLWWVSRKEEKNFRGPENFRPNLYRQFFRSFLWGFPVLAVLIFAFQHFARSTWGLQGMLAATAIFCLVLTLISARGLVLNRNRFHVAQFAYVLIITGGIGALALSWLPFMLAQLPIMLATLLFVCTVKYRPARMDFNLFLRATQGLLPAPPDSLSASTAGKLDSHERFRFARFLGTRNLVVNYRRRAGELELVLPPVRTRFLRNMALTLLPFLRFGSVLRLQADGTVRAHCHESDVADLAALNRAVVPDLDELENRVAESVTAAWSAFRAGDIAAAGRMVGELSEAEVFKVPVRRSPFTRWSQGLMLVSVALMFVVMFLNLLNRNGTRRGGNLYQPVSLTETEVRAALELLANPEGRTNAIVRDVAAAYFSCEVLPSRNLFSSAAWARVQQTNLAQIDLMHLRGPVGPDTIAMSLPMPHLVKQLNNHWLTAADLDWTPADLRAGLPRLSGWQRKQLFELSDGAVLNETYTILDTKNLADRVRCLRALGCLDLVDGRQAVDTLLRHQVTGDTLPAGRRQNIDPQLVDGTFYTSGWDPIRETWQALVILEAFGALERVDRSACIAGVLRFHQRRGWFNSFQKGSNLVILGDAQDTLYAFESLRILRALDQVRDLESWRFCPRSISPPTKFTSVREMTWEEIEAFVLKQRFERSLRERKENPAAPVRSLLEPD